MRRGRADAADESNPIMAVMSAARLLLPLKRKSIHDLVMSQRLLRASAQVTIARSAQDRSTHGNGDAPFSDGLLDGRRESGGLE